MKKTQAILYYFHDPMCSWCWGFKTVLQQLLSHLDKDVKIIRVLGGLAPDTDDPMPVDMREQVKGNWKRIEANIPGVRFNYDFWKACEPRRATYASCRAVIAARQQGELYDERMTAAIQQAYYQQARNPSDDQTLIDLAVETGLDSKVFIEDFYSQQVKDILQNEISFSREMFIESFPSLVLKVDDNLTTINIDYTDYQIMLNQVEERIDAIH